MKVQLQRVLGVLVVGWMMSPCVAAQERDPRVNPPVAPVGVDSTSKAPVDPKALPAQSQRLEQEPLSGYKLPGFDSLQGSRNFLLPAFTVSSGADLTSGGANGTRVSSQTLFNGNLTLRRQWTTNALSLDYHAGGVVHSSGSGQQTGISQGITIQQVFAIRRWTVTIADSLTFLPESGFGSPLLNQSGNTFGTGLAGGNPIFNPNQSILTGAGKRIANSASGQVQYAFNRQTSMTASANYGILRFLDGQGLLESNNLALQAGVNHQFDRTNTLGASFVYQDTTFKGVAGGLQNTGFNLIYRRRLSNRLTWQVGAGPEFRDSNIPGRAARDEISWTAMTRMLVSLADNSLGITYLRGSTNGSGVFLGSVSHIVEGTYTRQVGRNWSTSLGGGFAHNESATLGSPVGRGIKTWHANASAGRSIGRYWQVNTSYNYQSQDQFGCLALPGAFCGGNSDRHTFMLGLRWTFRAIELD